MARFRTWLLAGVAALAYTLPALAQSGSLSGRVTSSDGSRPIGGAAVTVASASGVEVARVMAGGDGRYRVPSLSAGTYRINVAAIGHEPRAFPTVQIQAGGNTLDAVLEPGVARLEEITVVSAERSQVPEKATQAPASVFALTSTEVTERPVLSVADHLHGIPGVDVSQGGLVQSNIVARGFNNIFSGALLTLIDYRYAAVPSLRVNVPTFFASTNDDIHQIEFVLGPGAALYGPNASNGVLNIITKSPFNSAGGVLNVEAGARAGSEYEADDGTTGTDDGAGIYRFSGRYAHVLNSKVAFKLSGDYLSSTEWRTRDAAEPSNLNTAHPELGLPSGRCNPDTGCRDFDLKRYGGEARLDIRPNGDADTEIVGVFGYTNADNTIEYTGIGGAQARDWKYTTGQVRFRHKRFFAQGFGNFSNSGETFLLRDGNPIIDKSRVWSGQFQHGISLGSRETILYGADYFHTDARTENTINGRNEDDDTIKEIGGYVHSVTNLTPKLDLVGALRVDKHSRLEKAVWSPRAGLVFRPTENHNLRVTFNRAFSTPSSNNLFLDISAGAAGPYTVRALGVPKDGFHFRTGDGCAAGGVDGLCMRTPFIPGSTAMPAQAALLWQVAVGAVSPNLPLTLRTLLAATPAPTPTQVGTQLRTLNTTERVFFDSDPSNVRDIERLAPTITHSIETGWKGRVAGGRVQLSVDGWYERKRNFVGPLIVESPNVFLNRSQTIAYLTAAWTPILGAQGAAQAAAAVGTGMAGLSGGTQAQGTSGVPLATVVPTNTPLTGSSDIFLTYRNFGEVELYGTDLAFDWMATSTISFAGSLSLVNKDFFTAEEAEGPTNVALNATKTKGTLSAAWRDVFGRGGAEVRFRSVKGFPVNSGVYVSEQDPSDPERLLPIDGWTVVDLQGNWKLPVASRSIGLAATLQNVFNTKYSTFVGVPRLGRLFLTKLTYTF